MEEFDPKKASEGLGDVLAKIAHQLGLDKVAEGVASSLGYEDCGCNRRRIKLNKIFPFKKDKEEPKQDKEA